MWPPEYPFQVNPNDIYQEGGDIQGQIPQFDPRYEFHANTGQVTQEFMQPAPVPFSWPTFTYSGSLSSLAWGF